MNAREIENLHREVERYLAAVDVFRREGCEPFWSTEEQGTSPNRLREAPDAMPVVRA